MPAWRGWLAGLPPWPSEGFCGGPAPPGPELAFTGAAGLPQRHFPAARRVKNWIMDKTAGSKTLAASKSSCFHEGFVRRQAIAGGQRSALTAMRGLEVMERGNGRLLRLPAPAIHPAYTAHRTRTPHDGRAPQPRHLPRRADGDGRAARRRRRCAARRASAPCPPPPFALAAALLALRARLTQGLGFINKFPAHMAHGMIPKTLIQNPSHPMDATCSIHLCQIDFSSRGFLQDVAAVPSALRPASPPRPMAPRRLRWARTPPKLGADPHSGCLRRRPDRGAARIRGARSQFAASLAPSPALRLHPGALRPAQAARGSRGRGAHALAGDAPPAAARPPGPERAHAPLPPPRPP